MQSPFFPMNTRFWTIRQAESFARTALELEPVWMDRAVQVPQRVLVWWGGYPTW